MIANGCTDAFAKAVLYSTRMDMLKMTDVFEIPDNLHTLDHDRRDPLKEAASWV